MVATISDSDWMLDYSDDLLCCVRRTRILLISFFLNQSICVCVCVYVNSQATTDWMLFPSYHCVRQGAQAFVFLKLNVCVCVCVLCCVFVNLCVCGSVVGGW